MKPRKIISHVVSILFVILMFSLTIAPPRDKHEVSLGELSKHYVDHWKDLKSKNLLSGSILIQQDGQTLYSDGDTKAPQLVASISKSFVGFLFYELSQQGMDLNQSVCTWLKNFCVEEIKEITLLHLLNHKSGFGRDISFLEFLKRTIQDDWELSHLDQLDLSKSDLKNSVGQKFLYSNFGFLVLSRVLEIVQKKSFPEIIRDLAVRKGLKNTSVLKKDQEVLRNFLIPFTDWKFSYRTEMTIHKSAGAGAIVSTAEDMVKWLGVLEEARFINSIFDNSRSNYAYGFIRSKEKPSKYWHNGGTIGVYAVIGIIPEQRLKVVVLMNNFKPNKTWDNEVEDFEVHLY